MPANEGVGQAQRYCTNCGAQVRQGSVFCVSCGTLLRNGGQSKEDLECFREHVEKKKRVVENLRSNLVSATPVEELVDVYVEESKQAYRGEFSGELVAVRKQAEAEDPELYAEYKRLGGRLMMLGYYASDFRKGKKSAAQTFNSMASWIGLSDSERKEAACRKGLLGHEASKQTEERRTSMPDLDRVLTEFRACRDALQKLKRDITSDVSFDEVLLRFKEEYEGRSSDVIASYLSDPDRYPEVENEGLTQPYWSFLFASLSAQRYYDGKETSAEAVAAVAKRLGVPVPKRVSEARSVEELHMKLEEKDREVEAKEREIEWLWEEVRRLRDAVGGLELDHSLAQQEEGRRLLAEEQAKLQKRKRDEKVAGVFTAAVQANILRHHMNDVNDSKKPGADLEEIRRRRRNPFRYLDFFDR